MSPVVISVVFTVFVIYIILGGLLALYNGGKLKPISNFLRKIKEETRDDE